MTAEAPPWPQEAVAQERQTSTNDDEVPALLHGALGGRAPTGKKSVLPSHHQGLRSKRDMCEKEHFDRFPKAVDATAERRDRGAKEGWTTTPARHGAPGAENLVRVIRELQAEAKKPKNQETVNGVLRLKGDASGLAAGGITRPPGISAQPPGSCWRNTGHLAKSPEEEER